MTDLLMTRISEAYAKVCESEPFSVHDGKFGYVARNGVGTIVGSLDFNVVYGDEAIDEISDTVGYSPSLREIDGLRKCVFVEELSVSRESRGNGIARAMMERLINNYGGTHQILLRAFDNNEESSPYRLAEMYSKFGFHELFDTENDGIIMIRQPR